MAIKEAKGEIILLGDFNTYYLIQSRKYIASKEQAEHFLAKINIKDFIFTILKKKLYKKEGNKEYNRSYVYIPKPI